MLLDFQSKIGRVSDVLPNVDSTFVRACLWIMLEAYKLMKQEKIYDLTWEEPRFSACLVGYMQKIRHQRDIGLRIDPESHLYREEILRGEINPATAPRIDIKISGGWVQEDLYYGIEAKILVELDWKKRDANYLLGRYIDTGIDNFVNGRYSSKVPKGCIVGYVVQGATYKIALMINDMLLRRGRSKEMMTPHSINGYSYCYQSTHIRTTDKEIIELYHILLTLV